MTITAADKLDSIEMEIRAIRNLPPAYKTENINWHLAVLEAIAEDYRRIVN